MAMIRTIALDLDGASAPTPNNLGPVSSAHVHLVCPSSAGRQIDPGAESVYSSNEVVGLGDSFKAASCAASAPSMHRPRGQDERERECCEPDRATTNSDAHAQ
jgi:hypothetical protein